MRYFTLLLLFLFNATVSNAQWTNMDSGINDNLTGLVFFGQNGLTSGANGLYYTTNGGVGASSWTRFEITDNAANATIYGNTNFTHCYADFSDTDNSGFAYACGQNTATGQAVIFKIAIPSMAYEIKYVGAVNTKLNKIDYSTSINRYIAVGDDGLLLVFNDTSLALISSGLTDDLLSLSTSGGVLMIGAVGKFFRTSVSASNIGTLTTITTAGVTSSDVSMVPNTSYLYNLGDNSFSLTDLTSINNPMIHNNQNFYSPLDANGIKYYSNNFYVGTDHGIYRCSYATGSSFSNISLEWQTSSLAYQINDFWKQDGNTDFYAFGANGVILKTNGSGGATKPYVRINSDGGCYPGQVQLSAVTGSGTSYNWYLNSNLIQSGTNNFLYNFPAAGAYTISLIVQNSAGEQSTDTKVVNVVSIPEIDKAVTLSDNILCKQETIQIQIANSEPNVVYTLKIEGQPNSDFGHSVASPGGDLSFTTDLIDVTGSYYIYAKNSLANCGRRFTDGFTITVEETKANFHAGMINAEIGESVDFFENTVDSQNFDWQFTSNASLPSSALPNPQLAFSATGPVTTTLHSWSVNGCHDTVTENKPFIFAVPAPEEDCFMLTNDSNDPNWPGYYNPDISQMVPTTDGFLICGTYYNEVFDSNYGTIHNMPGKKGGYLVKYDRDGVVKWVVYNLNDAFGNNNDNRIYATAVDSGGNIYISGKGKGDFIDNTGRAINLSSTLNQPDYYLIKLNPKGEIIWRLQNSLFGFVKMAVDHNNNLIAVSGQRTGFTTLQLYFNGTIAQEIGQQTIDPLATSFIVKFSPTGSVIWDTKAYLNSANSLEFTDLGIDANNNLYLAMAFDGEATIYQAGSNSIWQTISGDGNYGSKIGIMKMSPAGSILWKLRSLTTNTMANPTDITKAERMIVEDDGTIYLTGTNSTGYNYFGPINYTHVFESTDGTTVSTNQGPYFVAKVNTNGICQWIRGSGHTYYGYGFEMLKSYNEIFVVGQIYNNNADPVNVTALFDSTDGNGYSLTINKYDYFVSVYDESGNLKRLFVNNENTNQTYFEGFTGFFKGDSNHFYLAKNVGTLSGTQTYNDFGLTSATLNGVDGTVVRFTEECGILKYETDLGNDDWTITFDKLKIIPNPTAGEFSIDLNSAFETVGLEVYDVTGKMIAKQQFNNVTKVTSVVNGQSGIYFVKLNTADNQKWFKLIKE